MELVGAHVLTVSLQRLQAWSRIDDETRGRMTLWLFELSESLDRARALLRGGPEQVEQACRALGYLLLQVAPRIERTLETGRFPELPQPAGWEAIGEVPRELLELVQREPEEPTS